MKLTITLLLPLLLLAGGEPLSAQPATSGEQEIRYFTNAHIISGDGGEIEQGVLVIRGQVILDAVPAVELEIPQGSEVIDLSGKFIMPAMVNTHAHLGWEAYGDWGSQYFTEQNLIDHLYRHAYYGVGTIISTGSDKEDVARRVKLEQLKGNVSGARYLLSPGMGSPGGGPNPRFTDDPDYWGIRPVSNREEAIRTVREIASDGYRIAKIWVDDRDEHRGAQIKLAPEIYRAVLQTARYFDLRIIAHATTLADHKSLVEFGNRRFIHMPYDQAVDREYLQLAQEHNVYIVPTLGMITKREPYYRPAFEDPFFHDQVPESVLDFLRDSYQSPPTNRSALDQSRAKMLADNLFALKDHIILGTDAGAVGDFFGYADHVELSLFVRMGMTTSEAIIAATSRPARAFGLDNVGILQAGSSADFIILDANPLVDINNTRRINDVYLRGQRVDREALRAGWTAEK